MPKSQSKSSAQTKTRTTRKKGRALKQSKNLPEVRDNSELNKTFGMIASDLRQGKELVIPDHVLGDHSKVGRPPLYATPEAMQHRMNSYFTNAPKWSWNGLCVHLGMSRQSLNDYEKKKEFTELIRYARTMVAMDVEELTALGVYNPSFGIFWLKAFEKMSDKHDETNNIFNFINQVNAEKNEYNF